MAPTAPRKRRHLHAVGVILLKQPRNEEGGVRALARANKSTKGHYLVRSRAKQSRCLVLSTET